MNYREEEIRRLAFNDPIVKAALGQYDLGHSSWEQAMTLAFHRHNRQPAPVEIIEVERLPTPGTSGSFVKQRYEDEMDVFGDKQRADSHLFLQRSGLLPGQQPRPTDEGKRRYENGYYEEIPCTCRDDCPHACKGGCGCNACSSAYGDSLEWD